MKLYTDSLRQLGVLLKEKKTKENKKTKQTKKAQKSSVPREG